MEGFALLCLLWENGSTFVNKRWERKASERCARNAAGGLCLYAPRTYGKSGEIGGLSGRRLTKGLPSD